MYGALRNMSRQSRTHQTTSTVSYALKFKQIQTRRDMFRHVDSVISAIYEPHLKMKVQVYVIIDGL